MSEEIKVQARPPRDDLFRVGAQAFELRDEGADDEPPTMVGHFAVYDQPTEINSVFEGRFLERFSPGAFKKTIAEGRDRMRVLFQHGYDPSIGDKPLGPISELREDSEGAWYEVPLLDAPYVRDEILPGLRAGLYGASFRFRVVREEIVEEPERSDDNPDGLPVRTVKEADVREFGPVTFPAYQGASAGVRSITDKFAVARLVAHPTILRSLIEQLEEDRQPAEAEELEQRLVADETTESPEGDKDQTTPGPSPTSSTQSRGAFALPGSKRRGAWRLP